MSSVAYIAAVAHSINRAYCIATGDHSQPTWQDAPLWQKESAIAGVEFHIANPHAGPDASHNSWLNQKWQDGWTWGPVKNPDIKEHPCMVKYADLPKEQQAKDHLFIAVVRSMIEYAVE